MVTSHLCRVTPDRLLGRVRSAARLVAWGSIPLGALADGFLASAFGAQATLQEKFINDLGDVLVRDLAVLRAVAARIVPAAGASSQAFPRHCAQALATELRRPLAEFPGGHSGFMLRPQAFATQLREILASHR